jgi:hypothetical protein
MSRTSNQSVSQRSQSRSPSRSPARSASDFPEAKTKGKKEVVRFDFEEFKHEGRSYPALTNQEFGKMIDTIVLDARAVVEVTKRAYGNPDFDHYKKSQVTKFATLLYGRIDRIKGYHKAKAKRKGAGKNNARHLIEPFFVTDNLHDMFNGLNMGNGLAGLLIHETVKQTKTGEDKVALSEKLFVQWANQELSESNKTSAAEIKDLLEFHNPGYTSTWDLNKSADPRTFQTDAEGYVAESDPNLKRIVQIQNAYAKAAKVPAVTIQDAIEIATPQVAVLTYVDGNQEYTFNVADVLDVPITVVDPITGQEYGMQTSAINSGMNTTMLALFSSMNNLPSPGKTRRIRSAIFDQYLNGGNEDYPAGFNTSLYFGRNDLTYTGDKTSRKAIIADIKSSFPALAKTAKSKNGMSRVDIQADRYLNSQLDQPLTVFEQMAQDYVDNAGDKTQAEIDEGTPYLAPDPNNPNAPYGLLNFTATTMGFKYRISDDYHTADTRAQVDPDTSDGRILALKVAATHKYLTRLNKVVGAYNKESKKKSVRVITPKRRTRSPAGRRAASPVRSSSSRTRSSSSRTRRNSRTEELLEQQKEALQDQSDNLDASAEASGEIADIAGEQAAISRRTGRRTRPNRG